MKNGQTRTFSLAKSGEGRRAAVARGAATDPFPVRIVPACLAQSDLRTIGITCGEDGSIPCRTEVTEEHLWRWRGPSRKAPRVDAQAPRSSQAGAPVAASGVGTAAGRVGVRAARPAGLEESRPGARAAGRALAGSSAGRRVHKAGSARLRRFQAASREGRGAPGHEAAAAAAALCRLPAGGNRGTEGKLFPGSSSARSQTPNARIWKRGGIPAGRSGAEPRAEPEPAKQAKGERRNSGQAPRQGRSGGGGEGAGRPLAAPSGRADPERPPARRSQRQPSAGPASSWRGGSETGRPASPRLPPATRGRNLGSPGRARNVSSQSQRLNEAGGSSPGCESCRGVNHCQIPGGARSAARHRQLCSAPRLAAIAPAFPGGRAGRPSRGQPRAQPDKPTAAAPAPPPAMAALGARRRPC
ncbi:collagen alpha-1(I) chain-like [Eublepharis macularius]|uniref:Collagen alpha-1(I) chain-like n=1 Tax=Eublepharis macularius TaxID=481883 RepID=A0AA97K6L1_EUBMA|nr:collagen alpha-1(I) chain-like [Eublepharis macularius]